MPGMKGQVGLGLNRKGGHIKGFNVKGLVGRCFFYVFDKRVHVKSHIVIL